MEEGGGRNGFCERAEVFLTVLFNFVSPSHSFKCPYGTANSENLGLKINIHHRKNV